MARGRPRKIDPDTLLDTLMMVFWKQGFEGTSMQDLTSATNMAKPGLYGAFGDKEAMYTRALQHYAAAVAVPMLSAMAQSIEPGKQVFREYLDKVAMSVLMEDGPKGCFISHALSEFPEMPGSLQTLCKSYSDKRIEAFSERLKASQSQGEIAQDADIQSMAFFWAGQVLALTLLARSGASKPELDGFINVAMNAWPH